MAPASAPRAGMALEWLGLALAAAVLNGLSVLAAKPSTDRLGAPRLARDYRDNGMTAYTELQQEEFAAKDEGYAAVEHQAFVGTGYFDEIATVLSAGTSSTLAMEGSTEAEQFQEPARTEEVSKRR